MNNGGETIPSPIRRWIEHVAEVRSIAQKRYEQTQDEYLAGHWQGFIAACDNLEEKFEDEIIANLLVELE